MIKEIEQSISLELEPMEIKIPVYLSVFIFPQNEMAIIIHHTLQIIEFAELWGNTEGEYNYEVNEAITTASEKLSISDDVYGKRIKLIPDPKIYHKETLDQDCTETIKTLENQRNYPWSIERTSP